MQVLPLPNGDALVTGWTQTIGGSVTGRFIVRLDTDGARVSSFGVDGQVSLNTGSSAGVIDGIVALPDGKILAVVSENYTLDTVARTKITVFQFQSNGSPDPAFGGDGTVEIDTLRSNVRALGGGMAVDSQGRIVLVSRADNSVAVLRLTADGYLDTTFSGDGMAKLNLAPSLVISSMTLQPDGGILAAGSVALPFGDPNGDLMICRILADGTLDPDFADGGMFVLDMHGGSDRTYAICQRPNGKILAVGETYHGGANSLFVGLNQDGSLDTSFGTGGIVEIDAAGGLSDSATAATVMPDGRILANISMVTSIDPITVSQFAAVRLMPDGLPDSSFSAGGISIVPETEGRAAAWNIARDASGHILVIGGASNPAGEGGLLVRLQGDPDTDGDGVVDASETGTGIYVSPFDTGTDPNNWDTDGDGLSDGEEAYRYLTNPLLPDTDGDGFLDGYEVQTGKSPTDPLDKPALVAEARTAIEFTFPSAIGKSYRIEDSPNMATWGLVEDGISGNGGVVTRFYTTRNQQKRFFRVEESP
jgi:uncharacterized delta-60 repeat protein